MKYCRTQNNQGFSLVELIVAMTITIVLIGVAGTILKSAIGTKVRESERTDALTSAQAALNVMSREIANSGYGIFDTDSEKFHRNGIVLADSNSTKIRVRSNVNNTNVDTHDAGEDVTYYFDPTAQSIIRYDATPKNWAVSTETYAPSYVVNRISSVTFSYHNYDDNGYFSTTTEPTEDTARVEINVVVNVNDVQGVTSPPVTLSSDVTLRNSKYMMLYY